MSANPSPNATTPPPPGVGTASPHQIGRAFVKQYYKTLLTSPSQLDRFYQMDSTISRGMEPSAPANPSPFNSASSSGNDKSPGERVREAFFEWAGAGTGDVDVNCAHTDNVLRVDFERGAIDAQESINGGILVVVTGHMFLPGSSKEDAFVHTFFLNNAALPGRKKQFLVKNDVLRFLEPALVAETEVVEEVVEDPPAEIEQQAAVIVGPPNLVASVQEPTLVNPPTIEPPPVLPVEYEPSADEEKLEEDDVIEEPTVISQPTISEGDPAAKEEQVDVAEASFGGYDSSPTTTPTSASDVKKTKRNRKKRGGKSRSRSNSPRKEGETKVDFLEKPKTPGSWASLVASSSRTMNNSEGGNKGGRRGSPKSSRSGRTDKSSSPNGNSQDITTKAPPQSQPEKEPNAAVAAAAAASVSATPQSQPIQTQRSPEATLFIRNIPDKTTEPQIRNLFESHGVATGNKILGITLNPNRGFCFVDFDGPAAVMAIVNESNSSLVKDQRTGRKVESSFMVHGRVLDVERKVQSDRHKANSGGPGGGRRYNRSHSPKDGGGRYRGSRGGGGGGMRRTPLQAGGGSGGGGGGYNLAERKKIQG